MSSLFEIQSLGNLVLDQVFFETYYPIIFTCLNENNDLFLCVCCRSNKDGKKWLITKTAPRVVVSMLQDEITVREAFTTFSDVRVTVTNNGKEMLVVWDDEQDWDFQTSKSLPDVGEYLDADDGEFEEEIAYFQTMLNKYNEADLKEVEVVSPTKIEFSHNFSIDLMEHLVEEISFHKKLEAEIYRAVLNKIMEFYMHEDVSQANFLIDVIEENDDASLAA